jgi:alcohol dehydrogenase (cytochrome c)
VVGFSALGFCSSAFAAPVIADRLLNSDREAQNWLMQYQQYSSHSFSKLSQINSNTVTGLGIKYAVALGGMVGAGAPRQEATPLVNDGFMYVNNARNQVYKIDVRSGTRGEIVWKFDSELDAEAAILMTSRGIALLDDAVYTFTNDQRMIAIDANSGEALFEIKSSSPDDFQNQQHTGAPLAVKDMILQGQSNGFAGNRGWLGAFDAANGDLRWRFFVIPGPGEPGHETWADNHNAWRTGGGAVWSTPSYDPETETVIFGTGDAAPWADPEFRPGDNLFAISTVALNVNTGEMNWHFQEIPNESWDYDTISPRMIYNVEIDGALKSVQGHFSRNGYYYTLDRVNGTFLRGQAYVDNISWTAGLDPKTGKPVEYDPNVLLQNYGGNATRRDRPSLHCPAYSGGPTYFPPSLDTSRMTAYLSGVVGCHSVTVTEPMIFDKDWRGERMCCKTTAAVGPRFGHVTGFDVRTGEVSAKAVTPYPIRSGVMATAGDLVFTGHSDGKFAAYDSDTLAEVWSANVGTPIWAAPISFGVDGKQFIAVVAGGKSTTDPILEGTAMLFVFGL